MNDNRGALHLIAFFWNLSTPVRIPGAKTRGWHQSQETRHQSWTTPRFLRDCRAHILLQ